MFWKFGTGIIRKQRHLRGAICILHLWWRISISWFSSNANLEVEELPSTFHQRWIVKLTNPPSPTPSTESAQLARIIQEYLISSWLSFKNIPFPQLWSVVSGMSMFSLYFQFYSIQTWLLAWNGFTNSIELSNCLFLLPTLLHKIDSTSFNNSSSSLSGLYCHRFLARLLLPSWFWNRNKNVNIPEREGLFIELLCIEKYTS